MTEYFEQEEAYALVEAGLEALAMSPPELVDGRAGWVGEPGQAHYGKDTILAREWVTVEEAAERCNVTVREIEERYRGAMLAHFPGSVIEPLTEVRYEYDFETPGFTWEGYQPRETRNVDAYGPSYRYAPEVALGYVPDDDEGSDMLILKHHNVDGYDAGLEPKSRTTTTVVQPRLYEVSALMEIRERKVQSRKIKPAPARGKGGRFVKKTA